MDANDPGYRIAEVEKLTGVGRHTLRAWERRYGVPAPSRSDGRHRVYSMADVELVRRMRDLSARGVPLSRAAGIGQALALPPDSKPLSETLCERLVSALVSWDEPRALAAWTETFDRFDVIAGFETVLAPVMREIGNAWHAGTVTVAHEHFASNFVRARLDALNRQVVPMESAPTVLLACVKDEHHELGLLALSAALRLHGLRTIYLGRDTPDADLVRVVEDTQPAVLALNAGSPAGADRIAALVPKTTVSAPLTRLVFGGWVFDAEACRREIPGATYGGASLRDSVEIINRMSHEARRGGTK